MIKTYFTPIISILFFVYGCNSDTKKQEKPKRQNVEMTSNEIKELNELKSKTKKIKLSSTADYLKDYQNRKKVLLERLATATPQFANYLYLDFRKTNEWMANQLYILESNFLEDYEAIYDEKGKLNYASTSVNKIKQLHTSEFELWYVGEGLTEIRVVPQEYIRIFKGKVTPDVDQFIQLSVQDDEVLLINDAALAVPFRQMADILLRWEKFIKENKTSSMKMEAKQFLETYQIWYLFGLDNTPTREYETGELYEENKKEMERFVKQNPQSVTTVLVKELLVSQLNTEQSRIEIEAKQNDLLKKL